MFVLNLKQKIPESFKSLIEKCWAQKPFQRPTFDDILLELRENPEYITELYDENEFLNYIDYIDRYKISFDNSKTSISISPLDEIIEPNMIENNSELNLAKEKNESNMDKKETELNLAEKCTKSQLNIVKEKIDLNSSKSRPNSVECVKSLADNGDVNSMFNYAMMLEKGNRTEVDLKEASKYYKMATDNGHLDSMYNYAQMLFNGNGISIDKKEAAKYYKCAAERGHFYSIYNYAFILFYGIGTNVDKKESARFIKLQLMLVKSIQYFTTRRCVEMEMEFKLIKKKQQFITNKLLIKVI